MVDINGTTGNDNLSGTDDNDIFRPLTGRDIVDGAGGIDKLIVDYSAFQANVPGLPFNFPFPSTVTLDSTGLSGLLESRVGFDSIRFSHFEELDIILGARRDWLIFKAVTPFDGQKISVDGGGNVDLLSLQLKSIDNVTLKVDGTGSILNNLGSQFLGFEMFDIAVGNGTNHIATGSQDDRVEVGSGINTIETGDGDDTITSKGGRDAVFGGAGNDRWSNDLSFSSENFSLNFNGINRAAYLSKLATAAGIESVGITLGAGADIVTLTDASNSSVRSGGGVDSFKLLRPNSVLIDGGLGVDSATINLAGTIRAHETSIRSSDIGGFTGEISGYNGAIVENIERLSVILSDVDDRVTVAPASLMMGGRLTMSGGIGDDLLVLDFSSSASAKVAVASDGSLKFGTGTFTDFEGFRFIGSAGNDRFTGGRGSNYIDGGAGNDIIRGGIGNDILYGSEGNDSFYGLGGVDEIYGGTGDDNYYIDAADQAAIYENYKEGYDTIYSNVDMGCWENIEKLVLGGINDISGIGTSDGNALIGNAGANRLQGLEGNDQIYGGGGLDQIFGGAGADILTGGPDEDWFVFDTLQTSASRDVIKDFIPNTDGLMLSRNIFLALPDGTVGARISSDNFIAGVKALTVDHHIIYNRATGGLYYDADGAEGAAQIQIAILSTKPMISSEDIYLL